jgi:ribosome biogenesis GTPase
MKDRIEEARIISAHKEFYTAKNNNGYYSCKIKGKHRYEALSQADYPAVGDFVEISVINDEQAVIEKILDRKTILKKGSKVIATNVDVAFIVESPDRDFNLNRFERYLVLVKASGIIPVLVLNKIDTLSLNEKNEKITEIKTRFPDIDVILTSTQTKEDLEDLKNYIKDEWVYCFLGSSGVGKSSLANALLNNKEIETRNINKTTGRGKHTTTRRNLYQLDNGSMLIDTPGTREVGVEFINIDENEAFNDFNFSSKKCKFVDCTHTHEPGCAILEALEKNQLNKEKYKNYIKLQKESDYYDSNQLERKKQNKKFGKFIKNSKKDIKKINEWEK